MSEKPFNPMKLPVAERNAWFDGLSKRERAVWVAKDVLAQLHAKKYTAEMGNYFCLNNARLSKVENLPLQVVMEKEACPVCAIGASYASVARLGNKIETKDALNCEALNIAEFGDALANSALVAFTYREMRGMEVVFEGSPINNLFKREEVDAFNSYRKELLAKYKTHVDDYDEVVADALLRGIMQNVIDNEGRFLVRGVKMSTTKPYKW